MADRIDPIVESIMIRTKDATRTDRPVTLTADEYRRALTEAVLRARRPFVRLRADAREASNLVERSQANDRLDFAFDARDAADEVLTALLRAIDSKGDESEQADCTTCGGAGLTAFDEPDLYDWIDFEEDEADGIAGKYVLTIRRDEEEFAVIVHRTVDGKFPLDGVVADMKRMHAELIVDELNAAYERDRPSLGDRYPGSATCQTCGGTGHVETGA
ncbi:hypothetical protein [Agromyces humi]|uniref:hypothetical protein n=1 Tax=Agromyces humi TaxID=1766800 RepID=UPI00135A8467|nr:hypothetical protein [Agromyces humi]